MTRRLSTDAPAPSINELEWSLLDAKHTHDEETYYSSHGSGRGGIGLLVATGGARAGVKRLPLQSNTRVLAQSARTSASRGSEQGSTGRPRNLSNTGRSASARSAPVGTSTFTATARGLQSAGSGDGMDYADWEGSFRPTSSLMASTKRGWSATPAVARHEWEKTYPHPSNFQTSTRQTRIHDVDKASKWASISFFENDPQEIKRHLNICNILDQINATAKGHERRDEKVRHSTWANRQREVFRRQRQESAHKYRSSGLNLRETYVHHPPTGEADVPEQANQAPEIPGTTSTSQYVAGSTGGLSPRNLNFSVTGINCTSGALYATYKSASNDGIPVNDTPPSSGPHQPTISLPKPTFFKVHDRMINDSEESAVGRVHAHQRRLLEEGHAKEKSEAAEAVRMLDEFETQVRSTAKSRRNSMVGNEDFF